jgi:hypothetical protein
MALKNLGIISNNRCCVKYIIALFCPPVDLLLLTTQRSTDEKTPEPLATVTTGFFLIGRSTIFLQLFESASLLIPETLLFRVLSLSNSDKSFLISLAIHRHLVFSGSLASGFSPSDLRANFLHRQFGIRPLATKEESPYALSEPSKRYLFILFSLALSHQVPIPLDFDPSRT